MKFHFNARKAACIASAVVLILIAVALGCCSTSVQYHKAASADDVSASAQGFGGNVTVTLSVQDGVIKSAKIDGSNETPEIGQAALPELVKQLEGKGSCEIDGVSGATVTSNAVREAAKAALAKASGAVSASAQGFGGNVTVTISVKDGVIKSAEIDGPNETPTIGQAALPELVKQLEGKGSCEIDGVSGATVTSNAVREAAKAAFAKASEKKRGAPAASDGVSGATSASGSSHAVKKALTFTPGTYTGKGEGYNGSVEVSVTFDDKSVKDITVTSSKETAHVGDIAFPIIAKDIIDANGTGVDAVSGATLSGRALKEAVNEAAAAAGVSDKDAFMNNRNDVKPGAPIEDTWDIVIVGSGGAGISAAAQAAQDGNTVLVIERNAEIGGNTLVSGGQYQSAMTYLVWDMTSPDATTGVGFDGKTYDRVKSVPGCIDELKMIANWSEEPFDAEYYKTHEFVAGDAAELSKHGVHAEYLPTLQALKAEIERYLAWAQPKLDKGVKESELTLFSTLNLHIFQTYYGGLRPSADGSKWIYGDAALVRQFVREGQNIKPWLQSMGAKFVEAQPTLIGALWYRENEFIGAECDVDGDGTPEEYKGRWGTYFMAPLSVFKKANEHNMIMTRTTARKLITENGRVTGVSAERFDGTQVIAHAKKGVILATGGYAANIHLVLSANEYWSTDYLTAGIKTTNRSSLVGSGIEMAQEVGAGVTGMGWTQLMPISWVDNGNLAFGGGNYAVFLNPETGKRFVDEGSERDVLSLGEFRNGMEVNGTKGVFLEVYNSKLSIPGPIQPGPVDYPGRYYRRKAKAEELSKLFAEIGVKAKAEDVLKTIRDYDAAVMGKGSYGEIGKAIASHTIGDVERNADGSYKPDTYNLDDTLVTLRLMAPSTHHTMGGLMIDTSRRVLDAGGKPIPGLFAAGEVTGGIHGGNRLGGNAITEIIVSGRIAAVSAGAEK